MADVAHGESVLLGKTATIRDCAELVATSEGDAYMATMSNPFHHDNTLENEHDCFAVKKRVDGSENKLVPDEHYLSCFLKGFV